MSQFLPSVLRAAPLVLLMACGQPSPPATSAAPAAPAAPATPTVPATPATPTVPATPMSPPATAAPQPGPDNRTALLMLSPYVAQLAKAPALQADARVQQLSQQLITQATALEEGPATASLQPTLRTLGSLLQAAQQRAYPSLAAPAQQLATATQQLSGQPATPAEQTQHYQVIGQASDLLKQLIAQTPGAHR